MYIADLKEYHGQQCQKQQRGQEGQEKLICSYQFQARYHCALLEGQFPRCGFSYMQIAMAHEESFSIEGIDAFTKERLTILEMTGDKWFATNFRNLPGTGSSSQDFDTKGKICLERSSR
ncbi:hypothetical protein AC249_AIPGENE9499 [Exaiptasia diaphana]|nr:hypothetical protein AC249_AIPGENE9499 [Exaiptasia diaphana]